MENVKTIGVDLAKNVFFIHGVDDRGKTVLKKKLSRDQMLPFFRNLKPCVLGMEAGGGSNYWAREFRAMGHEAKLMAPQFVKPYVKTDKTDPNDAEAICEAVSRPHMRFVPIKAIEQQDLQSIHRIRERLVRARTALACEIRGFLGEYGIVLPQGIRVLRREISNVLSDETNLLTSLTRKLIEELVVELSELTEKIERSNERLKEIHLANPISQRLTEIPGVGIIAATAITASITDPTLFKNGRQFAAYLGLVPKQHSSGGKHRMLGMSKRGDKYIRTMLIHGARVAVSRNESVNRNFPHRVAWIKSIRERRGFCKAAVAVANKNARIIWSLMTKDEPLKLAA